MVETIVLFWLITWLIGSLVLVTIDPRSGVAVALLLGALLPIIVVALVPYAIYLALFKRQ